MKRHYKFLEELIQSQPESPLLAVYASKLELIPGHRMYFLRSGKNEFLAVLLQLEVCE